MSITASPQDLGKTAFPPSPIHGSPSTSFMKPGLPDAHRSNLGDLKIYTAEFNDTAKFFMDMITKNMAQNGGHFDLKKMFDSDDFKKLLESPALKKMSESLGFKELGPSLEKLANIVAPEFNRFEKSVHVQGALERHGIESPRVDNWVAKTDTALVQATTAVVGNDPKGQQKAATLRQQAINNAGPTMGVSLGGGPKFTI